jgi:hypothetical protein
MKSSIGEPLIEVLSAQATERGYRVVCRFSEPYVEPVAPGALYETPGSGDALFPVHRVSKKEGLTFEFETFSSGLKLPPSGKTFSYRGWWTRGAMKAALDSDGGWRRLAYPNDGTHEHCLFTSETISSYTGEKIGYYSANHGWITERSYMEFIVRDIYRLRGGS